MANKNDILHKAKKGKNDEFYTLLSDIEKEIEYYKEYFRGKVVYCNCDDFRESNFFYYFCNKFEELGLKKLIATGYIENSTGIISIYDGEKIDVGEFDGDGDFRSEECVEILKECDVVVTNSPFSLFRDYVSLVMEYGKQFLIIGNINAITYKEIFPYIRKNELWLGCSSFNSGMYFRVPDDYEYADTYKFDRIRDGQKVMMVSSICWYTNIEHNRRGIQLMLTREYNDSDYNRYSNYDAIEVSKVENIPMDYYGEMGVPITFLNKYCPDQFEIIGHEHDIDGYGKDIGQFEVNGKGVYKRILIRRLKNDVILHKD